jgi:hypothetical protein
LSQLTSILNTKNVHGFDSGSKIRKKLTPDPVFGSTGQKAWNSASEPLVSTGRSLAATWQGWECYGFVVLRIRVGCNADPGPAFQVNADMDPDPVLMTKNLKKN